MSTHLAWTVARTHLRAGLPMITSYWAIMASVYAVIVVPVATWGTPDVSIWATSGGSAPKYFLLALGIMVTTVFLPIYVGNGVTRRHFAFGASVYVIWVAAIYAVVMAIGYVVERPLYVANDLIAGLEDPYPVQSFGDWLTVLVAEALVGLVYLCVGWFLGSAFYRLGALWGIAVTPLAALPVVATEMGFDALGAGYGLNRAFDLEPPPLAVGVLIAAASFAVAWAANYALIRAVAINKVSG
jgi:hypothetical protein